MSNVIKSYVVRYDEDDVKKIDNHLKMETELLARRNQRITSPVIEDGFVEGIQALQIERLEPEEDLTEKANRILEEAKNEAKNILDSAKKEAEALKVDTLAQASKTGYNEGFLKSQKEISEQQKRLVEEEDRLQREYEVMVEQLEPKIADIMAELIEKMTGILVEDRKDVLLYLIRKASKGLDKLDQLAIRVGVEDYDFLCSKKDYLAEFMGEKVQIDIIEDSSFIKNQCMIETELKIIDCSLDVQLSRLITDIKLLTSI